MDSGGRKSTPGWLNFQRYGTFVNICAGGKACAWTIAQVRSILKEESCIGHSVHNKQGNISFRNRNKVRRPKEEWYGRGQTSETAAQCEHKERSPAKKKQASELKKSRGTQSGG